MLLEFLSSAGGGALAGGGLSLLGGLFGQSRADKARAADRRMAQAQFDAQMDQTLQRRVKDAQLAGIHPLFGLGASANVSPTLSAGGDSSSAGAPMANALGKAGGMLAQASIAKTQAEAQLAAAQAARIRQDMDSQGRDAAALTVFGDPRKIDAVGRTVTPSNPSDPAALAITRPAEDTAQKAPGVRAGETPLWVEIRGADGKLTRTLNPELEWDELIHPAVITYGWNRFWRGMKQNLDYVSYQLKKAGLSDQQIAAQLRRIQQDAVKAKQKHGTGEAGRRFNNRRRKM